MPHSLRELTGWDLAMAATVVAAMAIGATLAVAELRGARWHIYGDEARLAREAWLWGLTKQRLSVLTTAGFYSGQNLREPGPFELATLWPFVRVFGVDAGSWLYALAVNLGSLLVATWAVFRMAGRRTALVALALLLVTLFRTNPTGFVEILNVSVIVAPLLCCFLLSAAIAEGDLRLLPVLVLFVSYVVQTHVGYAPQAVIPSLVAVAVVGVRWRRHGAVVPIRTIVATAMLAGILWIPTAYDQIFETGNLGKLLRLDIPGTGLTGAWQGLGGMLNLRLWLDPRRAGPANLQFDPLSLLLFAAAGLLLVRARTSALKRAAPSLSVAVSIFAAGVISGYLSPPADTSDYHFYWVKIAPAFFVLMLVITLTGERGGGHVTDDATSTRARWSSRGCTGLTAATATALTVALPWLSANSATELPDRAAQVAAIDRLTDQLERRIRIGDRWQLSALGGNALIDVAHGVELRLIASGRPVDFGYGPSVGARGAVVLVPPDAVGRALGDVLGRYGTATRAGPVSAELVSWVRDHGPLVLAVGAQQGPENFLDGYADEPVCVKAIQTDPNRILDVAPRALPRLYASDQVLSPRLPDGLRQRVLAFQTRLAVVARELPSPQRLDPVDGPIGLVLSTARC